MPSMTCCPRATNYPQLDTGIKGTLSLPGMAFGGQKGLEVPPQKLLGRSGNGDLLKNHSSLTGARIWQASRTQTSPAWLESSVFSSPSKAQLTNGRQSNGRRF